jgi:hypothetical protein
MRKVISILEGDGPIKERLAWAANVFWTAMIDANAWPAPLRAQAEPLVARLLQDGLIRETISRMDELEARETADLLLKFAREFQKSVG